MTLRSSVLLLAALLLSAIFALDCLAGREFDLWIFYLAPIALVGVVLGPRAGYGAAAVAATLLVCRTVLLGNPYASSAAWLLDLASESFAYVLFVYLFGVARNTLADNRAATGHTLPPAQTD